LSAILLSDELFPAILGIINLKHILFFPVIFLLGVGYPIGCQIGGDYCFIPIYWKILVYVVGLFYSYSLSCALVNKSTRNKVARILLSVTAIYSLIIGSLFIIWQSNPYLVGSIQTLRENYNLIFLNVGFYVIAILCLYFVVKLRK